MKNRNSTVCESLDPSRDNPWLSTAFGLFSRYERGAKVSFSLYSRPTISIEISILKVI